MLQQSTVLFLKNLKKNNSKEWFDKNRKLYEAAKEDFTALVGNVITQFGKKDESIAVLQAKNCIFRINRDIRFSKDKSPYKTNMGASFCKGGKKAMLAGYYFHLEPGNSFVGGGIYMPEADTVKKIRQEIDYCFDEFKSIIKHKKFVAQYGDLDKNAEISLAREPKGYEKNNPAIDYLKLKSWIAMTPLSDTDITDKNLIKKVITAFEALQPMVEFLNKAAEL
jgi:uncharacterized protein (TIGR02453 family)